MDAVAAHLALALRGAAERDALPALHALARLLPPPEGTARAAASPDAAASPAGGAAGVAGVSGRGAAALAVAAARWLGEVGGSGRAGGLGVEVGSVCALASAGVLSGGLEGGGGGGGGGGWERGGEGAAVVRRGGRRVAGCAPCSGVGGVGLRGG